MNNDIVLLTMDDIHLEGRSNESKNDFINEINQEINLLKKTGKKIIFICAGDIGEGLDGINWAKNIDSDVVYVCGNHEFWGQDYFELIPKLKAHSLQFPNIHFLHNSTIELFGYKFIGTTLWTSLGDYLPWGEKNYAIKFFNAMADFRRITAKQWYDKKENLFYLNKLLVSNDVEKEKIDELIKEKKFNPLIELEEHKISRNFIIEELEKSQKFNMLDKTILVTHHLPCLKPWLEKMNIHESLLKASSFSTDMEFKFLEAAKRKSKPSEDFLLMTFYTNNLDLEIIKNPPLFCFHGHLHSDIDYLLGKTKIISNPIGYVQQSKSLKFKKVNLDSRKNIIINEILSVISQYNWDENILFNLKSFEKVIIKYENAVNLGILDEIDFMPILDAFKKTYKQNREQLYIQIANWIGTIMSVSQNLDLTDYKYIYQKSGILNNLLQDGTKHHKFKFPSTLTIFFENGCFKNDEKNVEPGTHYKHWLKQIQTIIIETNQLKKQIIDFIEKQKLN